MSCTQQIVCLSFAHWRCIQVFRINSYSFQITSSLWWLVLFLAPPKGPRLREKCNITWMAPTVNERADPRPASFCLSLTTSNLLLGQIYLVTTSNFPAVASHRCFSSKCGRCVAFLIKRKIDRPYLVQCHVKLFFTQTVWLGLAGLEMMFEVVID